MTIEVNNQTLHEVSPKSLVDKEPVYVMFPNNAMPAQWGIVDAYRHITIHKDLTIRFTDRCKYYALSEGEPNAIEESDNKIIQMRF